MTRRAHRAGRAPDPRALVVDPERLLAALEQGERLAEVPPPPLAVEVPRPPESTQRLCLRDDETALTTTAGTLVIRRRRAA